MEIKFDKILTKLRESDTLTGTVVTSIFGRSGDVVAQDNDYTWDQIDKTVSDIADITTKSHTSLTDIGTNTHTQIDSFVASKAQANGLASLDAGGKVPIAQLPSSIFEYKGVWDASTNTPTLIDGTGDTGDVYRVSVAGSQDLGSGSISFEVGDYVIYNGTTWEKSDSTDAVVSVNGYTGVVVLTQDDVGDGVNFVQTANNLTDALKSNYDDAYTHISSDGSDHGFIDQDVTTTASPVFAGPLRLGESGTTSGSPTVNAGLIIEKAGVTDVGISVLISNDKRGGLYITDTSDADRAKFEYNASSDVLEINTNGITVMSMGTSQTSFRGDFYPQMDSTYNLGKTDRYWQYLYVDRMYLNSTSYLDGSVAGTTGVQGDLDITGDIIVSGTVDGRDIALDGTNQDNHIADSTIHFTQGDISITASQVSDFDTEVSNNTDVAANTVHRTSDGSDHTYIDQDVTSGSSPTFTGINITGIPSQNVEIDEVGTATYDDLQDFINIGQSAGLIDGGVVTDGGTGTVDIASGTGYIRSVDSEIGALKSFNFTGTTGLALIADSNNWIYVAYNGGTPSYGVTADLADIDFNTEILIGQAYRTNGVTHIIEAGPRAYNVAYRTARRAFDLRRVERCCGLEISEIGTRNVYMNAGGAYYGTTKQTYTVLDTSVADTFTYWYRDGVGGWTEVPAQTQINNTSYDDGDGTLGMVLPIQYGVHWVFLGFENELHVVYGRDSYKLAEAEAALAPADLPDQLDTFAFIIGKIIIERDGATFTDISTAFETQFASSQIGNHNDLGLLQGGTTDQYYHFTSAEHTEINNFFDNTDITGAEAETLTDGSNADSLHVHSATSGVTGLATVATSGDHVDLLNIGTNTHAQIDSHISDSTIHFTEASIDHTNIQNIGTNTHAQIDSHIANITTNPHQVDNADVGLGNVDNVQQLPLSYLDTDGTLSANSDTKVPSQKAVKTYVDGRVASSVNYKGGYDADTNTPDLDTSPSGVSIGDMYTVTVAGTFFTQALEVGDVLISEKDNPTVLADWTIVNKDLDAASIKVAYESNADTNAFTDALLSKLNGIEELADVTDTANVTAAGALMDSELTSLSGIKTLTVPDSTTISTFGASLIDDTNAAIARTTLDVDQAGTDNSTDVTLAGTLDYLTLAGQQITLNAIDLTTDVSGVLPDANVADDITLTNITQITNRSHTNLTDIGSNTHAQIDTHIGSTSNPHSVTATQVGKDTAQWNANEIQGVLVDDTDIGDGKVLQYNSTSGNLEYETPAGGGNVSTSGTPVANDFARFVNATDIEGRSYSEVKSDLAIVASDISDFDTEVSNNTDVSANTTHRTSNGTDHGYINQDVQSTATPTFNGVELDDNVHFNSESGTGLEFGSNANKFIKHGSITSNQISYSSFAGHDFRGWDTAAYTTGMLLTGGDGNAVLQVNGNITLDGTVDGRDVAADGTAQDNHIADSSIHFDQIGEISDVTITTPADNELLAYDNASGDWINQTAAEAGLALASDLTSHTGDSTIHFTEASIDHTAITNIGTNTHAQIDSHIADSTIHFTEASISITASQVSDFDTEVANNTAVTANTAKVGFTNELAQDAIGLMIADTDSVNLTYTDATPELKADVIVDDSTLEISGVNGVQVKDLGITNAKLAGSITIDKIESTDKTGSDGKLVTGTAGNENDTTMWNTDGDVVGISGGWYPAIGAFSIASDADGLDYINVAQGTIDVLSAGMRIKVDQGGSTYYGIVHDVDDTNNKIGVFLSVASNTRNRLDGTAISNLYYSRERCPKDFPSDRDSWRIVASRTSNATSASTSYTEITSDLRITVPLGKWIFGWKAAWGVRESSGTVASAYLALSTSTTSASSNLLEAYCRTSGTSGDLRQYITTQLENVNNFTAETTIYMIGYVAEGDDVFILGSNTYAYTYIINSYL